MTRRVKWLYTAISAVMALASAAVIVNEVRTASTRYEGIVTVVGDDAVWVGQTGLILAALPLLLTLQAVESALREMEGLPGAITVVDNDSRDGSFEKLTAAVQERGWSRVRVLQSGHNGGYGAGNNFGIRQGLPDGSRPDFVYILNSDAFPEAGAIRLLADYLQGHPQVGFAGSRLHGEDGAHHQTAFRFPTGVWLPPRWVGWGAVAWWLVLMIWVFKGI